MFEKEDTPTERVKLMTLLSGEDDFQLARWDLFPFNPPVLKNDQHQFSPNNVNTQSKGKVMRISWNDRQKKNAVKCMEISLRICI